MVIQKILYLVAAISLLLFNASPVNAQTTPEPTPTPVQYISYDLPFPGILPDHSFYKLKVLRDKIQLQLIADPEEKIEFYLRLADKGILAAAMLIDKHNVSLAQTTALKAEHNMTLLIDQLRILERFPSSDLIEKLKTASLKHQEVLSSLLPRVSENERTTFETVIGFSKRNLQSIENYLNER